MVRVRSKLISSAVPFRVTRAKRGKFAYLTFDKADERDDASQGDVGKRPKTVV